MTTEHFLQHLRIQALPPVQDLGLFIRHVSLLLPALNEITGATFFIKDQEARYTLANQELCRRVQQPLQEVLGKRSDELFIGELGLAYTQQDKAVLSQQRTMDQQLELHLHAPSQRGWCLTSKYPIYTQDHQVAGLIGVSVDLQEHVLPSAQRQQALPSVLAYIDKHISDPLPVPLLAQLCGLSASQLTRLFKQTFRLTPHQYIQKKRLEHAVHLLEGALSITEIAAACGYADHSAFSRTFKHITGLSPRQFRKHTSHHKKHTI